MEKIDRELLIKDISSRLPYKVKAQVLGWDEEKGEVEIPLRIYSINTDGYVYFEPNDYDVNYLNVDDCLLYLRPMSSMTEEEVKMVCSMNSITVDELSDRIVFPNMFMRNYTIETFDLFNFNHLDHRGLIPMGLALEAPEGMYDIKGINLNSHKI